MIFYNAVFWSSSEFSWILVVNLLCANESSANSPSPAPLLLTLSSSDGNGGGGKSGIGGDKGGASLCPSFDWLTVLEESEGICETRFLAGGGGFDRTLGFGCFCSNGSDISSWRGGGWVFGGSGGCIVGFLKDILFVATGGLFELLLSGTLIKETKI